MSERRARAVSICILTQGMRAVQVLRGDTASAGGAESQIALIATALRRLGMDVTLIYGDGLCPGARMRIQGIDCVDAYPSWRQPSSLVSYTAAIIKSRPAVIYANLPDDFLLAGLVGRRMVLGSRFVFAIANDRHCNPWRAVTYRRWFHNPLFAAALWMSDFVTVQHKHQTRAVERYTRGKVIYVPNLLIGLREVPRPLSQVDIDVLWIAFIRPQKRLEVLIEVARRMPLVSFTVVGSFDDVTMDRTAIGELQRLLRTFSNINYIGGVQNQQIRGLLSRSRILLSTSEYEGFPNTFLEAWSQGVPVVSLEVDPGSVIQEKSAGKVSADIDQLTRDVSTLVKDDVSNEIFGSRGLEYVRKHHSLAPFLKALGPVLPGLAREANRDPKGTELR